MKKLTKGYLVRILIHPLLVALPLTIIAIFIFSDHFARYKAERIDAKAVSYKNAVVCYADLDGDGNSDEVIFFENSKRKAAATAILGNGKVVDQWSMNGQFLTMKSGETADIDKDGKAEIIMLYFRNDSAFLSVFKPMDLLKPDQQDIFIDTANFSGFPDDFAFSPFILNDINGDSFPEILFAISAGFGLYPRNLYAYDVQHDTVYRSPYLAVQISLTDNPIVDDLDNDGQIEILVNHFAPGNMKSTDHVPVHDNSSWILILDHNLQFWIPPVEFKATPSTINHQIISVNGEKKVLFLFSNNSNIGEPSTIALFDPIERQVTGKLFLDNITPKQFLQAKSTDQSLAFADNTGKIYSVDADLQIASSGALSNFVVKSSVREMDLDGCGQKEMLMIDRDYLGVYVFRNDNSTPVHLSITDEPFQKLNKIMVLLKDGMHEGFALHVNDFVYHYSYTKNSLYFLQWPFYFFIFFFLAGIYDLIMKFYTKQLRKIYQKDQQIAELKLKGIRNQLDPHFTFNAINAVSSALYNEGNKTAYTYFTKFAKLIRSSLLYSDRVTRLLKDELDYTVQYLEIEKFRFGDKFDYELLVDEDVVLTTEVPRTIIQAYAESAVSNGLMHRDVGGMLTITVKEQNNYLEIRVIDNGCGMEKSKQFNKDKAFKTIKIMDEFIGLINDMNITKIDVETSDLKKNDAVAGTQSLIKIPLNLRYRLS
ncbi:MAG: histidine kinase [Bacteroidales bacterium]|nr:histidine kinase [Bacteroidales bacterium]